MTACHCQEIAAGEIAETTSAGGRVEVRVVAGKAMGKRAVIAMRTPVMLLHYTFQPGGG